MSRQKSAQRPLSQRSQRRASALAAERARKRRRARTQRVSLAAGVLLAVTIVLVAVVAVRLNAPKTNASSQSAARAPAGVVNGVTGIRSQVFDAVGVGGVSNPPKKISAPPRTSGGKPQFLYAGAEYCPYCAVERWGVVAALARFGTWSKLGATTSSSTDQPASIATLSFHGASYTSTYLTFTGVEMQSNKINAAGNGYSTLDKLSAGDQKVFDTYDAPPYVPQTSQGSIPFLDIGGQYISSGASVSDANVFQGLTRAQIAAKLTNPKDPVTIAVAGTANAIAAAVCQSTGGKPASVCRSAGVLAATAKLGK